MFYVRQKLLLKKENTERGWYKKVPIDGELHGTCTCGEVFPITRMGDPDWSCDRAKMKSKLGIISCPRRRDSYGHVFLLAEDEVQNGKPVTQYSQKFESGCLYDVKLAGGDDTRVILKKEVIIDGEALDVRKFRRYEVTVALHPNPHVERLTVDGKEAKPSKSRVSAALTYITLSDNDWMETPLYKSNPFYRELKWVGAVLDSTSMAKVIRVLEDYPVLDSIYHNRVAKLSKENPILAQDGSKKPLAHNGNKDW